MIRPSLAIILGVGAAFGIATASASADSLDSAPETGYASVYASFNQFARSWMAKIERLETQNRQNPTIRPGPSQNLVTYRGFGSDYSVELRATGYSTSPFIGMIRYTEQIYRCSDVASPKCSIASTVPVTEIFRYQDGVWAY